MVSVTHLVAVPEYGALGAPLQRRVHHVAPVAFSLAAGELRRVPADAVAHLEHLGQRGGYDLA